MEIIKIKNLQKTYGKENNKITALDNINLTVKKGEFIAIIGPSGSGKSTLMHMLGLMDDFDSGGIYINKIDISTLTEEEKTKFRRDNIGFVFQFYNLLPVLTLKENIILPALLTGKKPKNYERLANTLKIKEKENSMPNDVSGGQQQRTAIARALINKPAILLADEPTGNLDSENAKKTMKILKYYNKLGQTIILVTHDLELAKNAKRIITIKDGKIAKDEINEKRCKIGRAHV